MNRRSLITGLVLTAALSLDIGAYAAEIASHAFRDGDIRSCRINLHEDALRMFWKDENRAVFGSFERLQAWLAARQQEIVCATNGGIYQEDLRPLGLYIEEGVVKHRLNERKGAYGNFYLEPNGVFLIDGEEARIVETSHFPAELSRTPGALRFATQSGPLLVQSGQINPRLAPLSSNRLTRNAVCVVAPHEVVLAMAQTPVSFYEFARFLRDTLKCTDALHLDSNVSRFMPDKGFTLSPPFGVIIAVTRSARPNESRSPNATAPR